MLAWLLAGRGNGARVGAGSRLAGTHTENSRRETRGGKHERPDERLLVAGIGGIHRFDGMADDSATGAPDPLSLVCDGLYGRGARGSSSAHGIEHRIANILFGGTVLVVAPRAGSVWCSGRVLVPARRWREERTAGRRCFPSTYGLVRAGIRFSDSSVRGTQSVRSGSPGIFRGDLASLGGSSGSRTRARCAAIFARTQGTTDLEGLVGSVRPPPIERHPRRDD